MVAKLVVYNRAPGGPQWYLTATWNTISPDSFRPSTAQGHLGSTWFDGMRTHAYTLYIYMVYMLCIYIPNNTYICILYISVCVRVFFLGGSILWTSLTFLTTDHIWPGRVDARRIETGLTCHDWWHHRPIQRQGQGGSHPLFLLCWEEPSKFRGSCFQPSDDCKENHQSQISNIKDEIGWNLTRSHDLPRRILFQNF